MDLENAQPDSKGISSSEPEVTDHGKYIAEEMHIDQAKASQHVAGAVEVRRTWNFSLSCTILLLTAR